MDRIRLSLKMDKEERQKVWDIAWLHPAAAVITRGLEIP